MKKRPWTTLGATGELRAHPFSANQLSQLKKNLFFQRCELSHKSPARNRWRNPSEMGILYRYLVSNFQQLQIAGPGMFGPISLGKLCDLFLCVLLSQWWGAVVTFCAADVCVIRAKHSAGLLAVHSRDALPCAWLNTYRLIYYIYTVYGCFQKWRYPKMDGL